MNGSKPPLLLPFNSILSRWERKVGEILGQRRERTEGRRISMYEHSQHWNDTPESYAQIQKAAFEMSVSLGIVITDIAT